MNKSRPRLPESYEGLRDQARSAYRSGDVEGAISQFRHLVDRLGRVSPQVLARRPELGDIHLQSGLELVALLRREGRYAEAMPVVERLLESHPETERLHVDLAVLRVSKGDVARGLADLRALADDRPDDVWLWMVLGDEARIEGRFAESQAALDRALEAARSGDDPEVMAQVHYLRFHLFRDMALHDSAVVEWDQAFASNSDVGGTVHELYTMLTDAGRYSQALPYLALDDNSLRAGFQRGMIASLTGDRAAARREWRSVAELDPLQFAAGHDAWVEALLRLGEVRTALERLPMMLARNRTPQLLSRAGMAWAMYGNQEIAGELLQESIQIMRHHRPPKQKLDSSDWRLLDSLVADEELKTALKPYFAVLETLWA